MSAPRTMRSWAARLALCALPLTGAARAAESPPIRECPIERTAAARPSVPADRPAGPGPTTLRADTVKSLSPDISELQGNAEATRDGERIKADYLRYDRSRNRVDASGNVTLTRPGGAAFTTTEAHIDLDTHAGTLAAGTYRLAEQQGQGAMARAEVLDEDRARLFDVRFTTCPPGREDWVLRTRRLDLDTAADVGVARHTTFEFFGVPLFYLPYFRFPISDERQSGFLVPQFGYGSSLGAVVGAPYYWNIAPNYDATLTPRFMTERGVQLQSEFRYLGATLHGQVEAEYLPDDRVTGENRGAGTWRHQQTFDRHWSLAVDVRGVSDKDYLSDFGDRLSVTAESYLPHLAEVSYRGSAWAFTARAADYQVVDRAIAPINHPYARLPQLVLTGGGGGGAQYRLESEFNSFERAAGVTGERLNINPSVSLPLRRVYGFIIPEVGVRHIAYSLDGAPESRPTVTAPSFSLDSGLYFEREIRLGARGFDQTLEPRIYYLYVPHRPQDALPTFDTSLPDFGFSSLFRDNRFIGGDRIGDANQITAAVTTRLLDQASGMERFSASIGRIYYFDQRRVHLPPAVLDGGTSDLAAAATAWLAHHWHARADVQWSGERDQAARGAFYVQYQPAVNKIFNIGYRLIRDQIEQTDVSAEWPVGGPWTLQARSIYSLRDKENVESYIGAQYHACCWAVRLYVARRLVQAASAAGLTEQRGRIALEFELAGLSRSASAYESPLRQGLFTAVGTAPP